MAGTELEHLIGSLERLRATFAWKAGGLDAAGLSHRLETSSLSLGRLLKHLSRAEDEMFTRKLWGEPASEPWRSAPWVDDPEWDLEDPAYQDDAFAAVSDFASTRLNDVLSIAAKQERDGATDALKADVLAELGVHVRRSADLHSLGEDVLQRPGIGALRMHAHGEVVQNSQAHTGVQG